MLIKTRIRGGKTVLGKNISNQCAFRRFCKNGQQVFHIIKLTTSRLVTRIQPHLQNRLYFLSSQMEYKHSKFHKKIKNQPIIYVNETSGLNDRFSQTTDFWIHFSVFVYNWTPSVRLPIKHQSPSPQMPFSL